MEAQQSIAERDLLVMQQIRPSISDEFTIEDADGNIVGNIISTDSTQPRSSKSPCKFDVVDADGSVVIHVSVMQNFGRDAYSVNHPDGALLAGVKERYACFVREMSIEPVDEAPMTLHGSFLDRQFKVKSADGDALVASSAHEKPGHTIGPAGRGRYALTFETGASEIQRLAVLGGMVALDLMDQKAAASANSWA